MTKPEGIYIDKDRKVRFSLDGLSYQGYKGDTLASALLRNGVFLLGRSFKFARPRGIMSCGVEESNALVTVGNRGSEIPNIKATEVILYEGLQAFTSTLKGNAVKILMSPLYKAMAAGFYYKTFIKPQRAWMFFEDFIRKQSGFASSPTKIDQDRYEHKFHYYDLVVVGGGIAGVKSALRASQLGHKVLLVDENPRLVNYRYFETDIEWKHLVDAVNDSDKIDVLLRSTAFAINDHQKVLIVENRKDFTVEKQAGRARHILHKVQAKKILLATGCHERPLLFENNDLPNIFLAGALVQYGIGYGVNFKRYILAGNNDNIYQYAALLRRQDSHSVIIIVDTRDKTNEALLQEIATLKIPVYSGYRLHKAKRGKKFSSLTIEKDGVRQVLAADVLGVSGGFSPVVHLACHTGSKPYYDKSLKSFVHDGIDDQLSFSGSARGYFDPSDCIAFADGVVDSLFGEKNKQEGKAKSINTADFFIPRNSSFAFLDMQNDVKVSDIELAVRENFRSIEHVKRYTALGFGTDQGKTSNINGVAAVAAALNKPIEDVGTTTYRPCYTPVSFGALAGSAKANLFTPKRYTPMQKSHENADADFEDVAGWMRPWYIKKGTETFDQTLHRECLQARQSVAMMDASTLGKIDIQGRDSREFLNRIYTNAWKKLPVGKCRYGLMLNEKGMIIDDGVSACIGPDRFLMTTTTGGAARVYSALEMWLQTEWPDLEVFLTSVTDHFSTTAVVGPKARRVLEKICSGIDLSQDAFKFMEWREGTIDNIPVRVMRISFSGELSFEINCQSHYGRHIWKLVQDAGAEFSITPYGTETMHILRAEKGYIIVGQDTDGTVTPIDADLSWAVARKKPFSFIGKRSLEMSDLKRDGRKQLVGLYPSDPKVVLKEGCQLVEKPESNKMLGHVTSSYMSPILGRSIAMALVKGGISKKGQVIYAKDRHGKVTEAKIGSYIFYDKEGKKVDGEL